MDLNLSLGAMFQLHDARYMENGYISYLVNLNSATLEVNDDKNGDNSESDDLPLKIVLDKS